MTKDQRDKLNRAISEKRGEWLFRNTLMQEPYDWCSDWRYAGKLLEEMPNPEFERLSDGTWALTSDWGEGYHKAATMTEAIALAWARMNGVSYE